LRVENVAESNRLVTFLSREAGLVQATHYGGAKSKMRASVSQFNSGTIYLYHDPVRNSNRISDFDISHWRSGFRTLYERSTAGQAIAETVLYSRGSGGNWDRAFTIVENILDTLDTADADLSRPIFVYFLWHWIECLGVQFPLSNCAGCGKAFAQSDDTFYTQAADGLYCEECAAKAGFLVTPGSRKWLSGIMHLDASRLSKYTSSTGGYENSFRLCTSILQNTFGKFLTTWKEL
jgi:DNA repair protein RecO (recombination protein O)